MEGVGVEKKLGLLFLIRKKSLSHDFNVKETTKST
jgi:hypothetical protein